mgnify:CR=1 FL=1
MLASVSCQIAASDRKLKDHKEMKMNNIKNMLRLLLISAVLLGFSSVTHAIPTLSFGGDITYDSGTGLLSLYNGKLQGSQDIIPAPDIPSSSISLSTTFNYSVSALGVTTGYFGAGSVTIDDMTTGSDFLLTGDFATAQSGGADGTGLGVLTLIFSPTGGTLTNYFSDPSDLFALTLNLNPTFGEFMFENNFSGFGNGNITSRKEVYEPGVLSLLMLGTGLIGISGWRRRKQAG